MKNKIIWGLIFVLHGPLDTGISYYGMATLGSSIETNPFMREAFGLDPLVFVFIKLIFVSLAVYLGYAYLTNIDYSTADNTTERICKTMVKGTYTILLFMGFIAVIGNTWVIHG